LHAVALGGLEQIDRPLEVGLDELRGPVQAPVHVRLGGEVDDRVEAALHQVVHHGAVGDRPLHEPVPVIFFEVPEVLGISRVRQRVKIGDLQVLPRPQRQPDEVRPDESAAAGHQNVHFVIRESFKTYPGPATSIIIGSAISPKPFRSTSMTRVPAPAAVALLAALLGSGLLLPAQDAQERIDKIFDRIEESRGTSLWQGIRELEDLGRGATEGVRKGLTRADAYVRIASAKVLYTQEFRDEALEALGKVMTGKNGHAKKIAADMAASLVGSDRGLAQGDKQKIAANFERQAGESDDPLTQVSLWRAVYNLTKGMKPVREVRAIHSGAGDRREVKEEAALALAEMDRFVDAKPTLLDLAKEPSERGRMAKAYLKVNELTEDINRKPPAAAKYDFKQLEEAIDLLKQN